jgi:RNA-directed DNA polymerase
MARTNRDRAFSSLHHIIDMEWMQEAYRQTRKDGAAGIDGVTAQAYEANLGVNLQDLLDRIRSGRYVAPPVRRAYIPKADGSQRPLGIPTFEDKVAQRAIAMLLEPIYEQDFLPCSYGFRPGRSAHDALHALRTAFMTQGLRWVLDIDIVKYFDSISHSNLRSFLDQRVTDGVVRRMIDKWLKAGVLEDDTTSRTTEGTPQGGVISPLLANIYLHYVLDEWFETAARPRLKGRCILVRYADDAVMAFEDHLAANGHSPRWANVSAGMDSLSIRTRRALWTSGSSGLMAIAIQPRTGPHSTSSASPMCGERRGTVRMWCGK